MKRKRLWPFGLAILAWSTEKLLVTTVEHSESQVLSKRLSLRAEFPIDVQDGKRNRFFPKDMR